MEWSKEDLKFHRYKRNRDRFKETTKEERAKILNNIICPKCGYQNHYKMVKKYGTCNLCKTTLDKDYFKKILLRRLKDE